MPRKSLYYAEADAPILEALAELFDGNLSQGLVVAAGRYMSGRRKSDPLADAREHRARNLVKKAQALLVKVRKEKGHVDI